ncbi:VOC family protein [Streptacidiphilus fuscans]|uniref:VOC family protein n=1 Tax=Streptacidiphilus fuscans TaxID=2789292 RepID=A0A931BEJ1_9ACTN|nr:VOC family protein [Streptacidiphilus fuscans]MBF9072000.1 VOC family protein [Streptacidiphilus fuscans]
MRLDHVSYAVARDGFVSTVQRLGSALGAGFVDGGVHPRFGTRNFVLPLASGTYVEVVTTLDHPAADRAPFGRAVAQRAEEGGGWLGWVVSVDDIAPVEARLGRQAAEGHRVRPDGFDLRWKQIGLLELLEDPQLPYFLQWLVDPAERPSADPRTASTIKGLSIAGDAAAISEFLGEPADHPLDQIDVTWVEDEEPGLVAVEFDTPRGPVTI